MGAASHCEGWIQRQLSSFEESGRLSVQRTTSAKEEEAPRGRKYSIGAVRYMMWQQLKRMAVLSSTEEILLGQ
jgi:hypothetical protein